MLSFFIETHKKHITSQPHIYYSSVSNNFSKQEYNIKPVCVYVVASFFLVNFDIEINSIKHKSNLIYKGWNKIYINFFLLFIFLVCTYKNTWWNIICFRYKKQKVIVSGCNFFDTLLLIEFFCLYFFYFLKLILEFIWCLFSFGDLVMIFFFGFAKTIQKGFLYKINKPYLYIVFIWKCLNFHYN